MVGLLLRQKQPHMAKVLIIKLGYSETLDSEISTTTSLGDVLRTTAVLHQFKDDDVTWLVDKKAYLLLENNPYIKRILIYDIDSVLQLQSERYDTVINFEKVPGICALADRINAWRRFGFRFDEMRGEAQSYDGAEMVYKICSNTGLKKTNKKNWQQTLVEMVGGKWEGQEYILGYKPRSEVKFDVGLNWAVGSKWPNKAWPKAYWEELEGLINKDYTCSWQQGLEDIRQYIDWIHSCKLLVTTDSLGLHIALALKKNVIILYGPTHSGETYLYGLGKELFPEIDYDCMPCLQPECTQEKYCMLFISPERVKTEIDKALSPGVAKLGALKN